MSDTFVAEESLIMTLSGALTTGVKDMRYGIPFNYELLGVFGSCGVAPTGAAVQIDILRSAQNGTQQQSIFGGTAANMLTIAAGAYDATAFVVPTAAGPASSLLDGPIETTANASQDPGSPTGTGVEEGFGALDTPYQGSPWAQPSGQSSPVTPYLGTAGDVFQLKVNQIGSSVAGSDLVVTLWFSHR